MSLIFIIRGEMVEKYKVSHEIFLSFARIIETNLPFMRFSKTGATKKFQNINALLELTLELYTVHRNNSS